jgi:DNA helicase-2/ATP-dependent DNA helicase PcrA
MAVAERRPELSLAILVSTNALGARVARRLQGLGARFDERLRGTAASRQVIALLAEALGLLADPLRRERYAMLFDALRPLLPADDPMVLADPEALRPLLRSCQPEILLYPTEEQGMRDALPPVAKLPDSLVAAAESLAVLCRRWMRARDLPVDQLILTIASDLLSETDMATAGRIASAIRMRAESNPERLLPALAGDLAELARSRTGIWSEEDELPFEPRPGVITLTTMHKAKGMEWDLVYLCGVDGEWFPSGLDDRFVGAWNWLGGDPIEEARSELLARLGRARHPGRSATEAAHIDLIAERMRLLYVGITRAKLWLSISWSQGVQRPQGTPRALPMSEAWRELKRFHESE